MITIRIEKHARIQERLVIILESKVINNLPYWRKKNES